ncbi:MAG: FAD synthetase family protein [Solirubrobacterales bacterium]|nr:FAD synthetase family protein [Solirubrobacterales bacterium]
MTVVTVGTFDGVHAGHRALLADARRQADGRGKSLVAVTFSPRPDVALGRARRPLPDLCSVAERVARLRAAGADHVEILSFTAELMRQSAAQFVAGLRERHRMTVLCVGSEFRCGRGGAGDLTALRALGVEVCAVPVLGRPGLTAKISSSTIRRAVAAGVPAPLAIHGWAPVLGHEMAEAT